MSHTHIRITSSIPGFRRAGLAHSTEPTTYPITDFSDTQLAQLDAEPRLAVEFITAKADPANDQTGAMDVDDVDGSVELDGAALIGGIDQEGRIVELVEMSDTALKKLAKDLNVERYTVMERDDLVKAIMAKEVND